MAEVVIAVDFDGTVVEHQFPAVGPDLPGAVEWLQKLVDAGAKLILWTMRSEGQRTFGIFNDAVTWYKARGIPLFGKNANPEQDWSKSPKAFAHLYIDDAALGAPLDSRGFIDWAVAGPAAMRFVEHRKRRSHDHA